MKKTDTKLIQEMLGDSVMQEIIKALGLQDNPQEDQEKMLAMLGENIFQKVMLELLIAVPESARDEFESLIGAGDAAGFRSFLTSHIPDLDDFIRHEATKELEATKTQLHMLRQGA